MARVFVTNSYNDNLSVLSKRDYIHSIAKQLLTANHDWIEMDLTSFEGFIDPNIIDPYLKKYQLKENDIIIYQSPLYCFTNNHTNGTYYFEQALIEYFKSLGCIVVGFHHDFIPFLRKEKWQLDNYNRYLVPLSYQFDWNLVPINMIDKLVDEYGFYNALSYPYHFPNYHFIDKDIKHKFDHNILYLGDLSKFTLGAKELDINDWNINFIGSHSDVLKNANDSLNVQDSIPPENASDTIRKYDYGLIWDQSNSDAINEYSRFNFPAKFSSYLSAGIPVIVGKKNEYIANLVQKFNIGYVIDKLNDIDNINVNEQQWQEQLANVIYYRKAGSKYFVKTIKEDINKIRMMSNGINRRTK